MPAVSKKQQRFFGYLLSNPDERKKKGISKKAAKDFAQDVKEEKKSCPDGEYYCFDMGKCRPIPKGHKVRADGELVKEAVKGQDTASRREGAKERAADKKSGKIRKNTLDPKDYATQHMKSIEWHDKRTKGRYTPGQISDVNEVAPPGWGHTKAEKEKTKPDKPKSKIGGSAAAFKRALDDGRFKGLPGDKTKKEKTASMFKLMWSMKKKGDKPHYKPGTDEKYKKYQDESFEINPKAHKTAQKKAKIRNLARGNENPNEKAAAEKRLGPKLVGEGASIIQGGTSSKKVSYRGPTSEKSKPKKSVSFRGEKDERIPRKNKHGVENKSARYASQLHRLRPRSERVKEETTMKDNNLFGNAYAGSYEDLKKKVGSKKKHDKPAIKENKFVDAMVSAVRKKKEEKKPEKAMDAGARAKRKLARKVHRSTVSDFVPKELEDQKTWSDYKKHI